jgi:ATP-dependent helicase/nuclease subunit A
LRQLGVHASELEGAAARVRAILSRVLADDKGRWVLSPHHHDIRTEYALAGVLGGEVRHVVIDRTFVDGEGTRWIVDYKSGSHEGGGAPEFLDREVERYRRQLEVYGALMARREPRPIRLGLYFPQLGGWREWAFPPS